MLLGGLVSWIRLVEGGTPNLLGVRICCRDRLVHVFSGGLPEEK